MKKIVFALFVLFATNAMAHIEKVLYNGPEIEYGNWDGDLMLEASLFKDATPGYQLVCEISDIVTGDNLWPGINLQDKEYNTVVSYGLWDNPSQTVVTFTLTEEILEKINIEEGCLRVKGCYYTLHKVTLESANVYKPILIFEGEENLGKWNNMYFDINKFASATEGSKIKVTFDVNEGGYAQYNLVWQADGHWDVLEGSSFHPLGSGVNYYELTADVANTIVNGGGWNLVLGGAYMVIKKVELVNPVSIKYNSAAGWGTIILPFDAEIPASLTAYECTAADGDGVITMTEATSISANTSYLIKGNVDYTFTGPGEATADNFTNNFMTGVFEDTEAPEGSYVLQKHGDELAFYRVDETKPLVRAGRCYINPLPSQAKPAKLMLSFGETTDIQNAASFDSENAASYNLAGQKVSADFRGIMIKNGRKFINK